MTKQQTTPELRFLGFNEKWKSNTLDQITTILKDGTHGTHKDSIDGPWLLSAKNLKNNKILISENDRKINQADFERIYKNYNLKRGDLLLSIVGTIGNVAIIENPENIAFQRSVAILRIKSEFFNKFFFNLVQTYSFKKKLKRNQVVSAQPGIYLGDLGKFQINFPSNIKEQEKIGQFFNKLDRQIELEEEKLELLEQQKKGYMQKTFTQELRFKDKNENDYPKWETKKIKELGNVYTGNTPSKKQSEYWDSKTYIWVTPTDIKDTKNLKSSEYMLSNEGFKKARQLPKNTLLITCIASIGKNAILREVGACNQQINALVPIDNNDVDFLYYAFEKVSKYMKRIAGKTATQIVNKSTFENIIVKVPNFEEQKKLGNFLNSLDKLIEKQLNKVRLLKQRKQGLLQKMFV
ncbi:restriction endonuclease subunit S [Staphylococcus caprae]|uniref:restriction endonuclease subunit S n=1 Tax=Staphylococcus caprae TaxID=29380 RepID=UPI003B21F4D2